MTDDQTPPVSRWAHAEQLAREAEQALGVHVERQAPGTIEHYDEHARMIGIDHVRPDGTLGIRTIPLSEVGGWGAGTVAIGESRGADEDDDDRE